VTWTHPACEAIARLVGARAGLHFIPSRQDSAEAGMRRAMKRAGLASLERYLELVCGSAAALDDLVSELTVGETYFFRDPAQFETIRRLVLPELRCRPDRPIRVWSAGCASGEEAYSLAMLFDQEGLANRLVLLATDVSRPALARARQAVYSPWSLRGGTAALPYLKQRDARHVVDEKIRRRVTFAYLNLAQDDYPSPACAVWEMDLILCRNVLIYLDETTVRRVASRLFRSLAPGGWLLTAASDPPLQERAPFTVVTTDAGLFYRRPREAWPGLESSEAPEQALPVTIAPVEETPSPGLPKTPAPATAEPDTTPPREDPVGRVRLLAGQDVALAERVCADLAGRQPLCVELHYLHAVLLLALGRDEQAIRSLERVIYLDRKLAVAHFTLGVLLARRGQLSAARRAFRNAHEQCAARPVDEIVPLSEGECAGQVAAAAAFHIAQLDAGSGQEGSS
jgi:chemotaxis protein methyltransferase CheR